MSLRSYSRVIRKAPKPKIEQKVLSAVELAELAQEAQHKVLVAMEAAQVLEGEPSAVEPEVVAAELAVEPKAEAPKAEDPEAVEPTASLPPVEGTQEPAQKTARKRKGKDEAPTASE